MPTQAVTFGDGVFTDSDWEFIIVELGLGGTGSANQVLMGGNPDQYRKILIDLLFPDGDEARVYTIHLKAGAVHAPAVDGAIVSIDYSEDRIKVSGEGSSVHNTGPALRQNGKLYFVNAGDANTNTWTSLASNGLVADDFRRISIDGVDASDVPDFSACGSPIELGFYRARGCPANAGPPCFQPAETGIDNWSLTINSAPVPDDPGGVEGLMVDRPSEGTLRLSWIPDCAGGCRHGVYRGDLGIGYSSTEPEPEGCEFVGSPIDIPVGAPNGEFFLVVPNDGTGDGSYGLLDDGSPRPAPLSVCFPQLTLDACAQ